MLTLQKLNNIYKKYENVIYNTKYCLFISKKTHMFFNSKRCLPLSLGCSCGANSWLKILSTSFFY